MLYDDDMIWDNMTCAERLSYIYATVMCVSTTVEKKSWKLKHQDKRYILLLYVNDNC